MVIGQIRLKIGGTGDDGRDLCPSNGLADLWGPHTLSARQRSCGSMPEGARLVDRWNLAICQFGLGKGRWGPHRSTQSSRAQGQEGLLRSRNNVHLTKIGSIESMGGAAWWGGHCAKIEKFELANPATGPIDAIFARRRRRPTFEGPPGPSPGRDRVDRVGGRSCCVVG